MPDHLYNHARYDEADNADQFDEPELRGRRRAHRDGWLNGFMFGAVLMLCSCTVVGLMVAGHFRII